VLEDRPLEDARKRLLPRCQLPLETRTRFGRREPAPQERPESAEEATGGAQFTQATTDALHRLCASAATK
jgi:hypothetical protein